MPLPSTLPMPCLWTITGQPLLYFPIMIRIPFVLAKPRERQEKKLIFNQSPSSAAIGRQIQHHLSLVFSLQVKEGRRAECLFLIPIMPDSFPGTYWGKCSTPHQGPEPFSSTWDRFELTCQRLTYSLQLNLKGKKQTNKQNPSCRLFPPCVLSFKGVFCWFRIPVHNINNAYLLLENQSPPEIERFMWKESIRHEG